MAKRPMKLLIADREALIARRIAEYISGKGIDCEICSSGKQLLETVEASLPTFVLIDLLFPDCSPFQLLNYIKKKPELADKEIRVMVTSSHNSAVNVKQAYMAGASDYLVKPFKVEDVLARMVFHMQKRSDVLEFKADDKSVLEGSAQHLHLIELILKEAVADRNPRQRLFNLMQMLALSMKAVRCSIIRTNASDFKGFVLASSDDIRVKKIEIDLSKYPEVTHTINTDKTTAIENIDFNPELARLKKVVKTISFNSIVVTPIHVKGEIFGVVSARMDSKTQKFSELQIRVCQLIADVCSLIISSVEFLPYLELNKDDTNSAA